MSTVLAWNERLLDGLNTLGARVDLVASMLRFGAGPLLLVLAGSFGLMLLRELRGTRQRAWQIGAVAAGGVVLTLVLVQLAGSLVHEARPFVFDADTRQLLSHAADNSFPSEHAAAAALIATLGALSWPQGRALFVAVALIIGTARVAAGLHYPLDVCAGWAIGAGAGLVAWRFAAWLALHLRLSPLDLH